MPQPRRSSLLPLFLAMSAAIVVIIALQFPSARKPRNVASAPPHRPPAHSPDTAPHPGAAGPRESEPRPAPPAASPLDPLPEPMAAPLTEREERLANLRSDAVAKERAGDFQAAIDTQAQALALSPDDALLAREMSNLYAKMGWKQFEAKDYKKAAGFFDEALHYWAKNEDAVRGMGFALFQDRDRTEAEKWLKRYIDLGGAQPDAYSLLGRIYYDQNRLPDARKYFELSLSLAPEQPRIKEFIDKINRELKVEAGFQQTDTSHFTIRYEGVELPEVSRMVMLICEEAYVQVGRNLGYFPDDPVTVILYTDRQFQDVTHSPAWAGAIFDDKIRIPAKGLIARDDVVERIVFHEYAHALIHDLTQGRAPIWLHEGLAQMNEGTAYDVTALSTTVVNAGGPWPLKNLEGNFLSLPASQAKLAYAESWLAVQYIEQRYGPYALRELLHNLRDGDNIANAVLHLTHRSYDEFSDDFQIWVRGRANP